MRDPVHQVSGEQTKNELAAKAGPTSQGLSENFAIILPQEVITRAAANAE